MEGGAEWRHCSQALLKPLQGGELDCAFFAAEKLQRRARGHRASYPAAEPAALAKSHSSDELGSL